MYLLLKASRLAVSLFEVRLMDEREQKTAEIGGFNSKYGDHGGNRTHDCQDENLES